MLDPGDKRRMTPVAAGKGILGPARRAMVHGGVTGKTARFSPFTATRRQYLLIFCCVLPKRRNTFYF
jgi:hypothetical protein